MQGTRGGAHRPQHGDEQRRERLGAGDQLPDPDSDRRGQQRHRQRVQPDVAHRAHRQAPLPLGRRLEVLRGGRAARLGFGVTSPVRWRAAAGVLVHAGSTGMQQLHTAGQMAWSKTRSEA